MIPFFDLLLIFNRDDVFDFQSLGPRECQPLIRRLEVIGYGALATDERAHLLARSHRIDVVILYALRCLQWANSLHEGRAGDSQLHRVGIVTVDAGYWMLHELPNLGIRHMRVTDDVETLHDVA